MSQSDRTSSISKDSTGAIPHDVADPYMEAIRACVELDLGRLPPDISALGTHLLAKLSPPQWTLEWYLPKWLGDAYALDATATQTLVLGNVYGLAFVGLQDKIADEGLPASEAVQSVCLGTTLHHRWMQQYVRLFPAWSPFWGDFQTSMDEWIEATAWSNIVPDQPFASAMQQNSNLLAGRAAPLKICCAAACHLSRQPALLVILAETLDHLHVAAVLVDHVHDWREDLAAGRYNTFVHFASDAPQRPEYSALNRQRVYEQLLLKDAGHAYFAYALAHMHAAIERAQETHCPDLIAYLRWYQSKLLTYRNELVISARGVLQSARFRLFNV